MRIAIAILCILFQLNNVFAQTDRSYETWYLGHRSGMRFTNATRTIIPPNTADAPKLNMFYGAATICDKKTGQLLFYTNGFKVFTASHTETPTSCGFPFGPYGIYSLIVPHPANEFQFYVFTVDPNYNLRYCLVDRRLNGGIGDVIIQNQLLQTNVDAHFTAVKQLYDNGYWIITHQRATNRFEVYKIDKDSFHINAVISNVGNISFNGAFRYGTMTTNSTGDLLVFTSGTSGIGNPHTELFHFDKRCGTLTPRDAFFPFITQFNNEFSYAAFSPNDRYLYVSYYRTSDVPGFSIYRYDLGVPDTDASKTVLGGVVNGVGDIQLAPDGLIYVTTVDGSNSTPLVGIIHQPDLPTAYFTDKEINLSPATPNYTVERFPGVVQDKSVYQNNSGFKKPELLFTDVCEGKPVKFSTSNPVQADSIRWFFGDGTTSTQPSTTHQYDSVKNYLIEFRYYNCGFTYVVIDTLKLSYTPTFYLGNDTTLCPGNRITLSGPIGVQQYLWSTGDSSASITIKQAGKYSLKAINGNCSAEDEINISYHPNIWLALGDEYLICDKDKELVRLDAGEGFAHYKWTPTGDTTQWIEVAETGNYFVVVNDFRGCKGEDGTTVSRRCPVYVYFPTAFTPNHDGLNDTYTPLGTDVNTFEMDIYNRWGERIFSTKTLAAPWNGMVNGIPAPADVYWYVATYSGFRNKRPYTQTEKGTISLIR